MLKSSTKQFRIGEDEKAIFAYLTDKGDFKTDSEVFRNALVLLYGQQLKSVYQDSPKREFMTFDEFVANELYKAKKEYLA